MRRIADRIVLYGHDGLAAGLLDGFVTTFVRTDSFEAVWTALKDGFKRAAGFKSVPNKALNEPRMLGLSVIT